MPREIDESKYISFGTYRADGSMARTPVWVVPFEGGYAFSTEGHSHKVRRLAANPRVDIAPCTIRGVIDPTAPHFEGTAEVLTGARCEEVERVVARKYFLAWWLMIVPNEWWSRLRGKNPISVAIKVTLD